MTKVAVIGVGVVGCEMARICRDRDYDIVAAVNRKGIKTGRDFGSLAFGEAIGVAVRSDLREALRATRPDVALIAVADFAHEMREIWFETLDLGVNAICVGCEASYLWYASASLAMELDSLARARGATFLGSGNQDFVIIQSGVSLLGVCDTARSLSHDRVISLDEFGARTHRAAGVGEPPAPTRRRPFAFGRDVPSHYEVFAAQLMSNLGLELRSGFVTREACTASEPLRSAALETVIAPGRTIGLIETVEAMSDGFDLVVRTELRLLGHNEVATTTWSVAGRPAASMSLNTGPPVLTTATQAVNRIPDILVAAPGYITLGALPPVAYRGQRWLGRRSPKATPGHH